VPAELITNLDLVFNIRRKLREKQLDELFWPVTRLTLWRQIKKAMSIASIEGPQATAKGFRHGFGVAMTLAGMDVYLLAQRLGHANAATSQIYRQVVGEDDHKLQMQYWDKANDI
jgi:site-specific recombinase XerD